MKHKSTTAVITILAMLASPISKSGDTVVSFYSAGDLRELFTTNPSMAKGYITGISDLSGSLRNTCMPEAVTVGQAAAVVKKALDEQPEIWHQTASTFVQNVLYKNWPCRNSAQ